MYNLNRSTIIIGDSRKVLNNIPNNSIQSVITSPPYWYVRDYEDVNQIGLEKNLSEYLEAINEVFSNVYRILKPNGVFWLNMGDCYTSGNRKYRAIDKKNRNRKLLTRPNTPDGLKEKDLIGLPWRLAIILQKNKWYLRSEIIWSKPNPMPESVKDRPHRSHEHLFMFTKSKKYLFNYTLLGEFNKTVWHLSPSNGNKNHISPFPETLIKPCILSSTNKGDFIMDPFYGSGTIGKLCEKYNRKFIGVEINQNYIKKNTRELKIKPEIIKYKHNK